MSHVIVPLCIQEERFLYPIYPMLAYIAGNTLDHILRILTNLFGSSSAPTKQRRSNADTTPEASPTKATETIADTGANTTDAADAERTTATVDVSNAKEASAVDTATATATATDGDSKEKDPSATTPPDAPKEKKPAAALKPTTSKSTSPKCASSSQSGKPAGNAWVGPVKTAILVGCMVASLLLFAARVTSNSVNYGGDTLFL